MLPTSICSCDCNSNSSFLTECCERIGQTSTVKSSAIWFCCPRVDLLCRRLGMKSRWPRSCCVYLSSVACILSSIHAVTLTIGSDELLCFLCAKWCKQWPVKARTTAQVEAESRSYAAGSATTLLQIGLGAPDGRVVGHVVVGCKQLHLCSDTHTHRASLSALHVFTQIQWNQCYRWSNTTLLFVTKQVISRHQRQKISS